MTDDALRRQLRFSLFLQGFAAAMMGLAAGVRIVAFGLDPLTAVLVVACLVIVAAFAYTLTKLRALGPANTSPTDD